MSQRETTPVELPPVICPLCREQLDSPPRPMLIVGGLMAWVADGKPTCPTCGTVYDVTYTIKVRLHPRREYSYDDAK